MRFGKLEISEFLCGGIIFVAIISIMVVATLQEQKITTRYDECTCNSCQCNECGGE